MDDEGVMPETNDLAVQTFTCVWDALADSPAEAVAMRLRSDLLSAIQRTVASWGMTRATAARRLELTGPRLDELLGRERAKDTSLDYEQDRGGPELVRRYAERRGLVPDSQIVVRPPLTPELEKAAPEPAPGLAEAVAAGRAGFRERFEAHRRQQQAEARDQAAARELVGQWDRVLTAYNAALPKLGIDLALGGTREQLAQFGRGVREQPGAVRVLREQGEAFGMAERPNLARIVADREPERVVAGIMAKAEDGMREQLRAAAELEAVRQRELRARQAARPSRGPSMGM